MHDVQQREYHLRRLIDEVLDDDVIPQARELARKMVKPKQNEKKQEMKTQLANLLNLTRDAGSIEAVKVWIQYQGGRKETAEKWKPYIINELHTQIDSLRKVSEDIVQELERGNMDRRLARRVHMMLIQQYVGQLRRCYIAEGGQ
jgi:hypothetical protein